MKKLICIMLAALSLTACKKEEIPSDGLPSDGKYLKKINFKNVSNVKSTLEEIVLNTAGDVTALRSYTGDHATAPGQLSAEYTVIEKNTVGKIVKV